MAKTNPTPRMVKYGSRVSVDKKDSYWYQDKSGNWHWHPGKFWKGPKPEQPEAGEKYRPGKALQERRSKAQGKEKLVKKYKSHRQKVLERKFGSDWRKQLLGGEGKLKKLKQTRTKLTGLREKQRMSKKQLEKLSERTGEDVEERVSDIEAARQKRSARMEKLRGRRQGLTRGVRRAEAAIERKGARRRFESVRNPKVRSLPMGKLARKRAEFKHELKERAFEPTPRKKPEPSEGRRERPGFRKLPPGADKKLYGRAMARRRKRYMVNK